MCLSRQTLLGREITHQIKLARYRAGLEAGISSRNLQLPLVPQALTFAELYTLLAERKKSTTVDLRRWLETLRVIVTGHTYCAHPCRGSCRLTVAGGQPWAQRGRRLRVGGVDRAAAEVSAVTVLWPRPWLTGSSWPWIYPAELVRSRRAWLMAARLGWGGGRPQALRDLSELYWSFG